MTSAIVPTAMGYWKYRCNDTPWYNDCCREYGFHHSD